MQFLRDLATGLRHLASTDITNEGEDYFNCELEYHKVCLELQTALYENKRLEAKHKNLTEELYEVKSNLPHEIYEAQKELAEVSKELALLKLSDRAKTHLVAEFCAEYVGILAAEGYANTLPPDVCYDPEEIAARLLK